MMHGHIDSMKVTTSSCLQLYVTQQLRLMLLSGTLQIKQIISPLCLAHILSQDQGLVNYLKTFSKILVEIQLHILALNTLLLYTVYIHRVAIIDSGFELIGSFCRNFVIMNPSRPKILSDNGYTVVHNQSEVQSLDLKPGESVAVT